MSLDVYLTAAPEHVECVCPHCGHKHGNVEARGLYSANITHNLNSMAEAAGIYQCLWRPEEVGIMKARQLVPLLRDGLVRLKAEPERFTEYNAPNGWGRYEHLVSFVEKYLVACEEHPEADVTVSR